MNVGKNTDSIDGKAGFSVRLQTGKQKVNASEDSTQSAETFQDFRFSRGDLSAHTGEEK